MAGTKTHQKTDPHPLPSQTHLPPGEYVCKCGATYKVLPRSFYLGNR